MAPSAVPAGGTEMKAEPVSSQVSSAQVCFPAPPHLLRLPRPNDDHLVVFRSPWFVDCFTVVALMSGVLTSV